MAQRAGGDRPATLGRAVETGGMRFIAKAATYRTRPDRASMPQDSRAQRAANTTFQSSFMLMTLQPCFLASAISESLKVPMLDFGP